MTVLGLISAIEEPQPSQEFSSWYTPEQIEYHCHNRILSALSDHLYDVYHNTTTTAKELWNTLEAEYGIVDAGIKRFMISNFNSYKMVENKPVGDQIHEYQEFLRKIEKGGTTFSEDFKVSSLIDKLPPSWDNFAKTLRHKQGELTLTQTINALRVEEKHRVSTNSQNERPPKVNLVENSNNNHNNFRPRGRNFKNKRFNGRPNNGQKQNYQNNNNKFKGLGRERMSCFVCGRTNHLAKDCYYKKTEPYKPKPKPNQRGPRAQVNVLVDGDNSAEPSFRYNRSLVNFTYQDKDWWLDSGANIHVCFDRDLFKSYQKSSGGSVTLGNDSVAQVLGIGDIELKMTSGKTLILKGVRHVPEVRRNLVSGSSLVQQGYKVVMESNKVVITRNDIFVGKGYVCDGLFKLNVLSEVNEISHQVFNVESCNV